MNITIENKKQKAIEVGLYGDYRTKSVRPYTRRRVASSLRRTYGLRPKICERRIAYILYPHEGANLAYAVTGEDCFIFSISSFTFLFESIRPFIISSCSLKTTI